MPAKWLVGQHSSQGRGKVIQKRSGPASPELLCPGSPRIVDGSEGVCGGWSAEGERDDMHSYHVDS